MAGHASQQGLCMWSLHTPATLSFLSFTHTRTLIKHTMTHTPLHCQLSGELGLLMGCYFITLIFHYIQEGKVLKIFPKSLLPLFYTIKFQSPQIMPCQVRVKQKSTNKSDGNLHSQQCFPQPLLLILLRQNCSSLLSFVYFCFMKE